MADEMTQEPTSESVPVAQETSPAVTGESQQVQADQSTAPVSKEQQEIANPDSLEDWNGNDVEKLPKPLQSRAKGILRYLHSETQKIAPIKHKAQAYDELVSDPELQEFVKWKEQRQSGQSLPPSVEQESLTEDEFLAAQTDPAKFVSVQQKLLMQQAQPILKEMQSLKSELNALKQERVQENAKRQLDAFADQHPDFWEIDPVVMKGSLEEIVQKNGGTIEEAYNHAKSIEKRYYDKANNSLKQKIEEKKKAVTAAPSNSMEPESIYVSNAQERNRIAGELAMQGKRVDVRVKR